MTMKDGGLAEAWAVVATLCALFIATTIWFNRAPALSDLAALPPIGMICFLLWQGDTDASIARAFHAERLPESAPPWDISIFTAIALVGALLAFWRSQSAPRFAMIWAGGAAVLAPAMLGTLEIFWQPSRILGANYWGLHVLAAACMNQPNAGMFCHRSIKVANTTIAASASVSAISPSITISAKPISDSADNKKTEARRLSGASARAARSQNSVINAAAASTCSPQ